jgi:hypothetical protein
MVTLQTYKGIKTSQKLSHFCKKCNLNDKYAEHEYCLKCLLVIWNGELPFETGHEVKCGPVCENAENVHNLCVHCFAEMLAS